MGDFDLVFSLFGVVLALCLTEVLTGLGRVLRQRRDAIQNGRTDVRLGLLTPLLAIFLMLDITSFWIVAWAVREAIQVSFAVLIFSLSVTSFYYVAASWVIPQTGDGGFDLDAYYLRHKSVVFALILASNVAAYLGRGWVLGSIGMPGAVTYDYVLLSLYYAFQFAGIFVRGKRANLIVLICLLATYAETTFGLGMRLASMPF